MGGKTCEEHEILRWKIYCHIQSHKIMYMIDLRCNVAISWKRGHSFLSLTSSAESLLTLSATLGVVWTALLGVSLHSVSRPLSGGLLNVAVNYAGWT